jgi:16S rRNA (cytosine967-C5)-methyltransferase
MRAELRRLRVDRDVVVEGDATQLAWWDGQPFERILLDAPCSGTGTLRRHPDIKLLKRASDLPQYQQLQSRLLHNLWRLLAPGGRLLYCTCSILSIENDCVIDQLIAATPDVFVSRIASDWGIPTRHGRQLLPEVDGPDGFYYAMLEKR